MKKSLFISLTLLLLTFNASALHAAETLLYDWGFNIDGTTYCLWENACDFDVNTTGNLSGPDDLPSFIDISGFDFATGLGTIRITIAGQGSHSVLAFFDHDIDDPQNGYENEVGSSNGSPAASETWEIDEPGNGAGRDGSGGVEYFGDILLDNFLNGIPDNTAFLTTNPDQTILPPIDVSMAMGRDFDLGQFETAEIVFVLRSTNEPAGFYLVHSDPDSLQTDPEAHIYLSSTLTITEVTEAEIVLFDWGFNIDGTTYCLSGPCDFDVEDSGNINGPEDLPSFIDTSGFDFASGLGSIGITIADPGSHSVLAWFDHDIDDLINSYDNEEGDSFGSPAAGETWEIDEPGFGIGQNGTVGVEYLGDIFFDNFQLLDTLDDTAFFTTNPVDQFFLLPTDVSMAMGRDFDLGQDQTAEIVFVLSSTNEPGGFYLVHSDPDSLQFFPNAIIYFSSTLTTGAETDCFDGIDNDLDTLFDCADPDCDGLTDGPCDSGQPGICATGTLTCQGAAEMCLADLDPQPDDASCDDLDNDCDGQVDEDYTPLTTSCGLGECAAAGATTCVAGVESDTCTPGTPGTEICDVDGLDEDCDGTGNEGCGNECTDGQTRTCGSDVGQCQSGTESCVNGSWSGICAGEVGPADDDATCDGLDDDCDGTPDEDFAPSATSCGLGECAAAGATTCVAGVESDTCTPGTPGTEICDVDGLDEDCDGTGNEGCGNECTDGQTRTCGSDVGQCQSGTESCVNGSWSGICAGEVGPADDDATCDGLDDDCDGTPDEDFTPSATSCGLGECAAAGATTCINGTVEDSCTPGTPGTEVCDIDGLDEDCDGTGNEGCGNECTDGQTRTCGSDVGQCQSGTESCVNGSWSGICAGEVGPADDDATCDGLDDDCDGTPDEDFAPSATSCGLGECAAAGATTCINGTVEDSCTPGTPGTEVCDIDGLDEDCDGTGNEGCGNECTDGQTRTCGSDVGQCQSGTESCVNGSWSGICAGEVGPADDDATCDGLDDDCDGTPDEDFAPSATSCGLGECAAAGATTCINGTVEDSCTPGTPGTEVCDVDGLDEDCDGTGNEGCGNECTDGQTRTCGSDVGQCQSGTESCVNGSWSGICAGEVGPADDDATCDGLDDDCDGTPDEDFAPSATSCGLGECAAAGATTCINGTVEDSCTPGTPGTEVCDVDGLDEDCDGTGNEGCGNECTDGQTRTCGSDVGQCQSGTESCVNGSWSGICAGEVGPADDDATCDGLDDDCDGTPDEDFAPSATSCGLGECAAAGATTCVAGVESDTCTPGTPGTEICDVDGLDEDCDGTGNEGCDNECTDGQTRTCGSDVGQCQSGTESCVNGSWSGICAGEVGPADDDATCDGLDDDCDGTPDEDFAPSATSCGLGECAAAGATTCINGTVEDSCTPGTPGTEICDVDGLDEDCDGTGNEGCGNECTDGQTRTCGSDVGQCQSGTESCVNGSWSGICAGEVGPADDDATCDGLDDDCDGTPDEDFAPSATSCGLGECAAAGATTCINGTVEDSCTPGTPGTEVCDIDGLDEDCDGTGNEGCDNECTDGQTRTCGSDVGQCQSGTESCVNGSWSGICAGEVGPADDDATCDGLDDDCDGTPDEDFAPSATSCGLGECAAAGATTCVAGVESDTCTPGTPGTEICDVDGLDEDCDGTGNEGCDNECTDGQTRTCGSDVGQCQSGTESCVNGSWSGICAGEVGPADDDATCDGLDDDCDGTPDEDFAPSATSCGLGECAAAGATTCINGTVEDSCTPGTPGTEICDVDGLDEDCDGTGNEGCGNECTDGQTRTCGSDVGQCQSGTESCVNGSWSGICAGEVGPADDDATCDGLDDDCDGTPDEDFAPSATSCGLGECAAAGATTCINGTVEDSCTPGTPGTEVCDIDGLDEDCDGTGNEGCDNECTDGQTRTCGSDVGQCQSGTESCVNGSWSGICAGEVGPADDDATCDGLDDDCDGTPDEDFAPSATSCGLGECAAAGATTCVAGVESDTCTPGTPGTEICDVDGLDEDCDGTGNEGCDCTEGDTQQCGSTDVGACSYGTQTCTNGSWGSCVGETGPAIEVCDGLDNDCDGVADGSENITRTCGTTDVGACTLGTETCDDAGNWVGCDAIEPAVEICSDKVDNDCDSRTDSKDSDCKDTGSPLFFDEDFESGFLGPQWSTNSTREGRIEVTSEGSPCKGSYHLTMDDETSGGAYSLNELVLTLDLEGYRGLTMSFEHKEYNDESHIMPKTFYGSDMSDGVAISADGQTWYKVQGLTNPEGTDNKCKKFKVDLDEAVTAAGILYTRDFKIKFQQYDNYPIPSDGFAFDNIKIKNKKGRHR